MNKIIITGRLGGDPELKTSGNGTEYTNFSLAVDRRKNKDEEKKTDWFRCVAFGKMAAFITTYFKKGDGMEVSGRMENDAYKDKETDKLVDAWKCVIENVEFPKGKGAKADDKPAANQAPEGFTPVSDDEVPF